jgi:hypothetical protein
VKRGLVLTRCVLLVALAAGTAAARQDQAAPATPPTPPAGAAGDPGAPNDERAMRELLKRGLERAKRSQKTIEEAVAMLDRGEPIAKVREFSREAFRADLMERGQEFRERTGRGGPMGPGGGNPGRPGGMRPFGGDGPMGGPGGPMGGPGGPEGDGPVRELLTDERALEIVKETNPALFERLSKLQQNNPEELRKVLERFRPQLVDLARQRQDDPDGWPARARLFMLDREANSAARRIAALDPDKRDEAKPRLRAILERAFDARLKVVEADIKRMQRRIEMLQREITDKNGQKDVLVGQRMDQMLKRADEAMDEPLGPGPEQRDRDGDGPPPPPPGGPGRPGGPPR